MEREKERHRIEELERRLDQEIRKNELVAGGLSPVRIVVWHKFWKDRFNLIYMIEIINEFQDLEKSLWFLKKVLAIEILWIIFII